MLLVFFSGLVPGCSRSLPARTQDDALLLSIASHTRMSGDPELSEYALMPTRVTKLSAGSSVLAPQTTTELDILVNLYSGYLNTMRQQGNLSNRNVDRLVDQLQGKIANYQKRSARLEQRRRRRGGGLGRFFRRVGRGIGRFIRRVGRAIGWAAEYLVEEVAPQVIKDMVLTGQPLTARVFWSGVRKLVRKRLKGAIGSQLARKGVPVVLLEKAGLAQGDLHEDRPPENEDDEWTGEGIQEPAKIAYGNHRVSVTNDAGNEAYFTVKDYWTNLPDNGSDDCQVLGYPTADVDAYIEGYDMWLEFELDSGQISGAIEPGDGEFKIAYEETEWVYAGLIEDGWVQPSTDASGWDFGGSVVFDITIGDRWRCWHCNPVEGGCNIVPRWLEDEKSITVRGTLEGWTEQIISGNDIEPDRLAPGGAITVTTFYEGSDAELYLECLDCTLPADFPPPVYLEE